MNENTHIRPYVVIPRIEVFGKGPEKKPSMSKVTISILTFTALEHAKACIASVFEHSGDVREWDLILTANGSPEAAKYFHSVAREHKNVRVVVNQSNMGFIEPNRRALEMCETPHFLMLNDDALVPQGWLNAMIATMEGFANSALVGPMGSCCSLKPNLDGFFGKEMEFIEGSCLMGKTELLKKHGMFPEYLKFAYSEDSALSLNMRRLGYTIHQAPFRIVHHRQQTSRHIPGIHEQRLKNQAEVAKRFSHYLRVKKFGYPITVCRKGAIGDVLLTTAIVEALANENPLSKIYVETDCVEVYRNNPHVTKAANKVRFGDKSEQRIDLNMAYERRPAMNYLAAYAEAAGVEGVLPLPKIYPSECDFKWAKECLNGEKWCAIHAGPSWVGRTWPMLRWYPVIEHLRSKGLKVLLVGQKNEILTGDLDARGLTTLHQLAALIAGCSLFVGIDSLPLHLANIASVPTIGLFGITWPGHVFTNAENSHWVKSSEKHPESGKRHMKAGMTMIHVFDNPMDTISLDAVNAKIDEVVA